jgi:hypothetical protein
LIAALVSFGVALIVGAILGARVTANVASPAVRLALLGLGAACLLGAATSVLLTLVQGPAQPTAAVPSLQTPRTPRVMVVGDDGPEGSIRRSDPAFESALAAFEEQLRRNGFAVSDGRAIATVDDALDRRRRPDAEIVQLVRRQQREPLDAVVVFSLFVRLEFGQGGPTLAGRSNTILSGRGIATLLRVADSANMGVFEAITPTRWPAGFECARTCQVETTGAEAPLVAEAIANQVVATLRNAR